MTVTDFGADSFGGIDATASIQATINSCQTNAGCEIYFPPGVYALSSTLTIPTSVPITLAGAGQLSSILQPTPSGPSTPVNYDIISVGSGATGFTAHDFDIQILPMSPPINTNGAIRGAAFHLTSAKSTSLYNLHTDGAYDVIELGDGTMPGFVNQYTYIRSVNSNEGNHCFLRLDGAVSDVFVRGIFAEANKKLGSQIICLPSSQLSPPLQYAGVSRLHVSDSSFQGFTRGLSFSAAQMTLRDFYFDNLYLDTADNGPSFEVFLPPGSSSLVSNIRLSNSTLVSAATACVVHGASNGVRMSGVSCDADAPAPLPSPCPTAANYPRGYALVEVSGPATNAGTASITVHPPSSVLSVTASYNYSATDTASSIASGLGLSINNSTLANTVNGSVCTALAPAQVFQDITGGTITPHYSIGPDIELYSFKSGTAVGLTPTISATASAGTGVSVSLPNVVSTFLPADGIYVGSSTMSSPQDVTVTSSSAVEAQSGAGLHLQGGSSMLFIANHFGGAASQNLYGARVDLLGAIYQNVQVQDNDLQTAIATNAVSFQPGSLTLPVSPGIALVGNLGFNPAGYFTPQPTTACNTVTNNPYPFAVEAYISGTFSSVYKNTMTLIFSSASASQTLAVFLGVGESLTVMCSAAPSIQWFGQ